MQFYFLPFCLQAKAHFFAFTALAPLKKLQQFYEDRSVLLRKTTGPLAAAEHKGQRRK